MKIGKITINSKLALAPMAGVTDLGFRTVCRELGAGYTVTEMVSAKALCYQDKKSLPLLELGEGEHPAAVQLFGSDPYCMEQAAGIAAEKSGAGSGPGLGTQGRAGGMGSSPVRCRASWATSRTG